MSHRDKILERIVSQHLTQLVLVKCLQLGMRGLASLQPRLILRALTIVFGCGQDYA